MGTPSKLRREGREAYKDGYGSLDCPYKNEWMKNNWLEGWREAYDEDRKKEQQGLPVSMVPLSTISTVGDLYHLLKRMEEENENTGDRG